MDPKKDDLVCFWGFHPSRVLVVVDEELIARSSGGVVHTWQIKQVRKATTKNNRFKGKVSYGFRKYEDIKVTNEKLDMFLEKERMRFKKLEEAIENLKKLNVNE
jgi:hypothetical protein